MLAPNVEVTGESLNENAILKKLLEMTKGLRPNQIQWYKDTEGYYFSSKYIYVRLTVETEDDVPIALELRLEPAHKAQADSIKIVWGLADTTTHPLYELWYLIDSTYRNDERTKMLKRQKDVMECLDLAEKHGR